MAVNTSAKRFSMMNFGDGANTQILFEVDGTVNADDRVTLLGLYGGFFQSQLPRVKKVYGYFVGPGKMKLP